MKDKIREWAKTKGKEIADRWTIFLLMMLVALAMCILAIPVMAFFISGCIIYILGAGLTAILNEIFCHKPVDETFENLYDKLLDKLGNVFEN